MLPKIRQGVYTPYILCPCGSWKVIDRVNIGFESLFSKTKLTILTLILNPIWASVWLRQSDYWDIISKSYNSLILILRKGSLKKLNSLIF